MKAALSISILVFVLPISFFTKTIGSSTPNDNYWECKLNDILLIKGNRSKPDSIVTLTANELSKKGTIFFSLFLDAPSGKEIHTTIFLASNKNSHVQVSDEIESYVAGHFTTARLKTIADSTNSETFTLKCLFDGIQEPWKMFKISIQK